MNHPFAELAAEYGGWVVKARPRPECVAAIDQVARRLTHPDALVRLGHVFASTGIPIVVQATIGERECGFDFTKNWGQGDPLTRPSTHVPKNRPPLGAPPNDHFPVSWEYAAIDAFTVCDKLNVLSVPQWGLPYACWKWEGYNGFGYRAHGVRTPYVLGGTTLQQPGKYIYDGTFDSTHMDTQLGTLPVALRMIELVPSLSFGQAIAVASVPDIVTPVPVGVGGGDHNTKWIQHALNVLGFGPLLEDGNYGRITRNAVRAFQTAQGLTADGLAGPKTFAALESALSQKV